MEMAVRDLKREGSQYPVSALNLEGLHEKEYRRSLKAESGS